MGASLRTFLIADVRGYTTYTREHGDERAAELASNFARIVEQVCTLRDGVLLELRGDEALVVFTSARQAIRAALELQDAFVEAALPRGVGIGLDAGEAIPVGEGFRGGALNLAARLCSKAHAGEVLASETVIHLAAQLEDIVYIEPRTFRLKGYVQPVRAVQVVRADRVPSKFSRRVRRVRARLKADRRIQIGVAVVIAVALVGALVPQILAAGTPLSSLPAGTAILDAKSGQVLVRKVLGTAPNTGGAASIVDGHLWLLRLKPALFIEVDPHSGKILKQIAWPISDVGAWTVAGQDIWVTDNATSAIIKVDIGIEREVDRFDLADGATGGPIIVADGSVWVGRFASHGEAIVRIDPQTGKVLHRFDGVSGAAGSLAYADGIMWAGSGGGVSRVDLKTNAVLRADIQGEIRGVAAGGGFGWASDDAKGVVYKISPSGHLSATYETGEGATNPTYSNGLLWVANADVGTVSSIDAITGARRTLVFGHPTSLVAGDGFIAVDIAEGRSYEDRIDALQGSVARFYVSSQDIPEETATAGGPFVFHIEYATCAKLLNFADASGPSGGRLQPEVAAAMPLVSKDGRTYTFTVRTGFKFSPPSGAAITADTFKYSIERALSSKLAKDLPGRPFLADLAGFEEFTTGKTDHISGIRVSNDRLSFTLRKRSGDFLYRLTQPYFCPVPTGTPFVPGGADRQLPGSDGVVPSSGPYYIADHLNGEYMILKRNPNYLGPRPHGFDSIAFRMGVDPGKAVDRVEKGQWGGVEYLDDDIMSPTGPLAARWDATSAAGKAGDQRFYLPLGTNADYLLFNTRRGPFRDATVRRAVALVLNRTPLAGAFDESPEDRLSTDLFAASQPHVYTLDTGEVNAARRLMNGRHVTVRTFSPTNPNPRFTMFLESLSGDLKSIGIHMTVEQIDDYRAAIQTKDAPYDLYNGFTVIDYPDAAGFLRRIVNDAPPGWLSQSVVDRISAVDALVGNKRDEDASRLADELVRSDIPLAVFGTGGFQDFLSPQIGCRVFSAASFGIDLAAMCHG
jgi:ABC-type oligopeptide transport system substrate-binding subunit/class 3 adenylate cyclase